MTSGSGHHKAGFQLNGFVRKRKKNSKVWLFSEEKNNREKFFAYILSLLNGHVVEFILVLSRINLVGWKPAKWWQH